MIALPAGPEPVRRRTLFVGTAFASAAMAAFFAGLIALYIQQRHAAGGSTKEWLPEKVGIPMVPANTMLFVLLGASIMAQWAVHAMHRGIRRDTITALTLTGLLGVATLNAQSFIWAQMKLPILSGKGQAYNTMFFTITGAFFAAVIAGIILTVIGAFRSLAGHAGPDATEGVSAIALYWHVLFGVFCFVWLVVYVVK